MDRILEDGAVSNQDLDLFLCALRLADLGLIPVRMINLGDFIDDNWISPIYRVAGFEFEVFNNCYKWDHIEWMVSPNNTIYHYAQIHGKVALWKPVGLYAWLWYEETWNWAKNYNLPSLTFGDWKCRTDLDIDR